MGDAIAYILCVIAFSTLTVTLVLGLIYSFWGIAYNLALLFMHWYHFGWGENPENIFFEEVLVDKGKVESHSNRYVITKNLVPKDDVSGAGVG